ncbi:MAG: hypothetical protein M3534_00750 [Actinomycetota bacterium]|nr:hypothetical protein [Actinomycetota bacterium]
MAHRLRRLHPHPSVPFRRAAGEFLDKLRELQHLYGPYFQRLGRLSHPTMNLS